MSAVLKDPCAIRGTKVALAAVFCFHMLHGIQNISFCAVVFFGRPCDSQLFIVAEHNLISQESALF